MQVEENQCLGSSHEFETKHVPDDAADHSVVKDARIPVLEKIAEEVNNEAAERNDGLNVEDDDEGFSSRLEEFDWIKQEGGTTTDESSNQSPTTSNEMLINGGFQPSVKHEPPDVEHEYQKGKCM